MLVFIGIAGGQGVDGFVGVVHLKRGIQVLGRAAQKILRMFVLGIGVIVPGAGRRGDGADAAQLVRDAFRFLDRGRRDRFGRLIHVGVGGVGNIGFGCVLRGGRCRGLGAGRSHGAFSRRGSGGRRLCRVPSRRHGRVGCCGSRIGQGGGSARAEHNLTVVVMRLDPPRDLALGNPSQHFGIGCRRFRPEVTVVGRQVTKIFGNCLHCIERVIESFEGARKSAIGDCKYLTGTNHWVLALLCLQ